MATKQSRQTIMDRLNGRTIAAKPHPAVDHARTVSYPDPVAKFTEILTWVGGRVQQVDDMGEVSHHLHQLPHYQSAKWIASTVSAAVQGNFNLAQAEDPHSLAELDWSIIGGEFCVAENGAIWVAPQDVSQRAMVFIAQHLAIIVSRSQMVMHMHDAYRRLGGVPGGPDRFGVFVSGPSKTADIEQSLVLGAHGCRTLEVFLTP